jgi:hypothetical protein
MEQIMVPWTVIYKTRGGEILSKTVMAPIGSAEAWPHVQNELPGSTILALVKGNHEVTTRGADVDADPDPEWLLSASAWKGATVYK